MKVLSIVISLYILCLAWYPCADTMAIVKHGTEKSSDHSHESDSCSPFCVCSCCGVQMIASTQLNYFRTATTIAQNKLLPSTYKPEFISNYFGSIWQPPQIA